MSASAIRARLQVEQVRVAAAERHELVVGAMLVAATAVFAGYTVLGLGPSAFFDDWLYTAVAGGGAVLAIWTASSGLATR